MGTFVFKKYFQNIDNLTIFLRSGLWKQLLSKYIFKILTKSFITAESVSVKKCLQYIDDIFTIIKWTTAKNTGEILMTDFINYCREKFVKY